MRNTFTIAGIVALFVLGSVLAPQAKGDVWDQLTKVTFNGPVEIPGQVLPAGTYWFKLLDSPSDRNIVQIFNEDRDKVFATILAVPDYRLKPTGKTVITFEERAAKSPPAIKAWFYPGDLYGQEFVYPKRRAMELAKASNQPVPSMPANLEANTKMPASSAKEQSAMAMKKAPVKAEQPSGGEVEIGSVVTTPPQLLAKNNPPPESSNSANPQAPSKLPATTSPLSLVALVGFTLAGTGLLVRVAARKMN